MKLTSYFRGFTFLLLSLTIITTILFYAYQQQRISTPYKIPSPSGWQYQSLHSRMLAAALAQAGIAPQSQDIRVYNSSVVQYLDKKFTYPLSPSLARSCIFQPLQAPPIHLYNMFSCTEAEVTNGTCCRRAWGARFVTLDPSLTLDLVPYVIISAVLAHSLPVHQHHLNPELLGFQGVHFMPPHMLIYSRVRAEYNLDLILDRHLILTDTLETLSGEARSDWFRGNTTIPMSYFQLRGTNQTVGNWGDIMGPHLVETLSGQQVVQASRVKGGRRGAVLVTVGSMLGMVQNAETGKELKARKLVFWGTGLIADEIYAGKSGGEEKPEFQRKCLGKPMSQDHIRVLGVRGPLSRLYLLCYCGVAAPVTRDPALLMSRLYQPAVAGKNNTAYEVCLILHYIDEKYDRLFPSFLHRVKILTSALHLPDKVVQCRRVLSSTLHGGIVAQAYGIPTAFIQISDGVVGGDFKFRDHHRSLHMYGFQHRHKLNRRALPVNISYYRQLVDGTPQFDRMKIDYYKLRQTYPLKILSHRYNQLLWQ